MKKLVVGLLGSLLVLLAAAGAFLALKQPAQRPAPDVHITVTQEKLARGEYLVKHVGACLTCHSQPQTDVWGIPPTPGTEGQGAGFCWDESIGFPGKLCPANITQDKETGIGAWTDGEILRAIREGVSRDGHALFPIMGYPRYASMSDQDAESVVAYIKTLKPIRHEVPKRHLNPPLNVIVKFTPKPLEGPVTAPDPKDEVAYGKYLVTLAGCQECHTPTDDKHRPVPGMDFAGGQTFHLPWGTVVTSANLTPDDSGLGKRTRENFISMIKAYEHADPIKVDPTKNTVMQWLPFSGMTEHDLGAIYAYLRTVAPVHHVVEKYPHPDVKVAGATAPAPAQPSPTAVPAGGTAPAPTGNPAP